MAWEMREQEFESVVRLPAPEAYAYFVKRCAEHEEVWGLRDAEGWVTSSDDEGQVYFPAWPHPAYASACAVAGWEGATPEAIDVDEWVEDWLPGMKGDGLTVLVFPVPPENMGVPVQPDRLADDLQEELGRYELD